MSHYYGRMLPLFVLLAIVALIALLPATGFPGPGTARAQEPPPKSARDLAVDALQARTGNTARITADQTSGEIKSVYAGLVPLSDARGGDTASIARDFLNNNAALFGVDPAFVDSLVESTTYTTGSGLRVTELAQYAGGYEVFRAVAKVSMDPAGRVVGVANSLAPGRSIAPGGPTLDAAAAKQAAYAIVGPPEPIPPGAGQDVTDALDPPAKLYVYDSGISLRFGWAVRVQLQDSPSRWFVLIDAETGGGVFRKNLTSDVGPEGTVFVNAPTVSPNPCPTAGPNPLPCGQTGLIPFTTASATPYSLDATHTAWVTATSTSGNNVVARDESAGTSTPDGPAVTAAGAVFNFPFQNSYELTGTPSAQDISGAVTNLFYQNNYMHDWMYTLGFTEAARNFQENNFALGGVGSDSVNAGAMFGRTSCPPGFGTCRNNANFSTDPDGTDGIMRMYLFTSAVFEQRDGDLDGDIIVHEYGHGVSNRLIGNAVGIDNHQGGSMGEAWSDYLSISRYNDPVVGEYATGDFIKGIRTHAYENYPHTYGDLCSVAGRGCEVHDDGELWAAVLWDLRARYRAILGATPGTMAADQAVFDGIATTPNGPTMLQARDAVIAAEVASGGGINVCEVWDIFGDHGFGYSAVSLADTGPIIEAFDRDPSCGDGTIGFSSVSAILNIGEAAGTLTLVIERTGSVAAPASVTVDTTAVTATNADFGPVSGMVVNIPAGSSRATATVTITNDVLAESGERFLVQLSNATGARLGIATTSVTIIDNETIPLLGTPVDVPDGNGTGITRNLIVSGVPGNITDINVLVDVSHTYVGDFRMVLTHPDTVTVATIVDRPGFPGGPDGFGCTGNDIVTKFDDAAGPVAETSCVNDGGAPPTGLRGASYKPTTALSTFNGKNANGTWVLRFADHATPDAPVVNAVALEITPAPVSAGGTLSFVNNSFIGNEGDSFQPQVQRTGGSSGPASVFCASSDGSALGGADYNHILVPLTWADGEAGTKVCPQVTLTADGSPEGVETFDVKLYNPAGAALGGGGFMEISINASGGGGPTASKLAFNPQPGGAAEGQPLNPQPRVEVQASDGTLIAGDNGRTVTLTLNGPTGTPLNGPNGQRPTQPQGPIFTRPPADGAATDAWAVRLADGVNADAVAASLSAVNLGQVGQLQGVYVFQFPGFAFPDALPVLNGLRATPAILEFQQQFLHETPLRVVPTDPLFGAQWHLKNTGQGGGTPGADVNVEPAWTAGRTGAGVVIGIVDDGVEYTHPDLSGHYNAAIDHDYLSGDTDPAPGAGDFHGTAVAGVAAADNEGAQCGVGAAYDATLVGVRLVGAGQTDAKEAGALQHLPQTIQIYNSSWGPSDNGTTLGAPGALAAASIAQGATAGRGGLGSIQSWAAGNGRGNGDNVNYDGYANSPYVIPVGALLRNDTFAPYSEPGAALFISVGGGSGAGDITTTDRAGATGYSANNCTGGFNGTSSAAPLLAGVVALILQANPNLSYRDVMHILAETAVKNDPGNGDWFTNAAGFEHNHNYGFGRADAAAAVTAASTWQNVGPRQTVTKPVDNVNTAIPENNPTGLTRTINVTENIKLEHVEVIFDAAHTFRGDLVITLTSPSGTVSRLAELHNDGNNNYPQWRFSTVRNWGEMSPGIWTMKVSDGFGGDTGTWNSWQLILHGTDPITGPAPTLTCDQPGNATVTVNGVAQFTGCSITPAGTGYSITATAAPLTSATSNDFTVGGGCPGNPVTGPRACPNPSTINPTQAGAWGALWTGSVLNSFDGTSRALNSLPAEVTAVFSWFNGPGAGAQSFKFWFRGFPDAFNTLNQLDPGGHYFFQVSGATTINVPNPQTFTVPPAGGSFTTVAGTTGQLWNGNAVAEGGMTGLPGPVSAVFRWDNPNQVFDFWFRGFPDAFNTLDTGLTAGGYYFFQDSAGGTNVPTP